MPTPIYQNPPDCDLSVAHLTAAALNLYNAKGHGAGLTKRHYQDNANLQCIKDVSASIVHYIEQYLAGKIPDHGAVVGTMPNGHSILHATYTHHGQGNCTLFCEFNYNLQDIRVPHDPQIDQIPTLIIVHGIGGHYGNYSLDGVSNAFDAILTQNIAAGHHCRYANAQHDLVVL